MKIHTFNLLFVILVMSSTIDVKSQSSENVPLPVDRERTYLFYLHGGVVQELGRNAISQYYGKYEYDAIVDTLKGLGFYVISEVRPKGTDDMEYARKIKSQVDTLLTNEVSADKIIIVGASLGAYMTLNSAKIINNPDIRYVLIGLCSAYAIEYYTQENYTYRGQFLSIYESSDSKQSCQQIFNNPSIDFEEIVVNMGIDHAFLFKPYREWIDPLYEWIRKTNE